MHKKSIFILGILVIVITYRYVFVKNTSTLYSFDQLIQVFQPGGIEQKKEAYSCLQAETYRFFVTPHKKLPLIYNTQPIQSGTYFIYSLEDLDRDLFVEKITFRNDDGEKLEIKGDLDTESCRFNRYQAADRPRIQILDFLTALSHLEIQKAKNLMQEFGNLTPFKILDRCQDFEFMISEKKLGWSAICLEWGWPWVADFDLFISEKWLYLRYNLDYEKEVPKTI